MIPFSFAAVAIAACATLLILVPWRVPHFLVEGGNSPDLETFVSGQHQQLPSPAVLTAPARRHLLTAEYHREQLRQLHEQQKNQQQVLLAQQQQQRRQQESAGKPAVSVSSPPARPQLGVGVPFRLAPTETAASGSRKETEIARKSPFVSSGQQRQLQLFKESQDQRIPQAAQQPHGPPQAAVPQSPKGRLGSPAVRIMSLEDYQREQRLSRGEEAPGEEQKGLTQRPPEPPTTTHLMISTETQPENKVSPLQLSNGVSPLQYPSNGVSPLQPPNKVSPLQPKVPHPAWLSKLFASSSKSLMATTETPMTTPLSAGGSADRVTTVPFGDDYPTLSRLLYRHPTPDAASLGDTTTTTTTWPTIITSSGRSSSETFRDSGDTSEGPPVDATTAQRQSNGASSLLLSSNTSKGPAVDATTAQRQSKGDSSLLLSRGNTSDDSLSQINGFFSSLENSQPSPFWGQYYQSTGDDPALAAEEELRDSRKSAVQNPSETPKETADFKESKSETLQHISGVQTASGIREPSRHVVKMLLNKHSPILSIFDIIQLPVCMESPAQTAEGSAPDSTADTASQADAEKETREQSQGDGKEETPEQNNKEEGHLGDGKEETPEQNHQGEGNETPEQNQGEGKETPEQSHQEEGNQGNVEKETPEQNQPEEGHQGNVEEETPEQNNQEDGHQEEGKETPEHKQQEVGHQEDGSP